ncbi:hypothetical protein [Pseudolysinimonas sp.]
MRLRYPLALGVFGVALGLGAVVVGVVAVDLSAQLQELYAVNGLGGQMAMDALVRTANLVQALQTVTGPLALAAVIPVVGSIALLVLRQRAAAVSASAVSASATASRDA